MLVVSKRNPGQLFVEGGVCVLVKGREKCGAKRRRKVRSGRAKRSQEKRNLHRKGQAHRALSAHKDACLLERNAVESF